MYLDFLGDGLFRALAEEFGDLVFDPGLVSMRELESGVDANPQSLSHVRSLGFRLVQDAQPIRARKCFETALSLDPADFQSRIGMACALEAVNRCQMAIEHVQLALGENPASCIALVAMGFCRERLGDLDEARRCYQQAMRVRPGLTRTRERLENFLQVPQEPVDSLAREFAHAGTADSHAT